MESYVQSPERKPSNNPMYIKIFEVAFGVDREH